MTILVRSVRTVTFNETGKKRVVKRLCPICFDLEKDRLDAVNWPIVSPMGVVHHSGGYGDTDCGRNATGERWWWQE